MNRRSFLQLSTGAGVALAARFSAQAALAAALAERTYGGLPVGIQTYTLRSLGFDAALQTVANELKLKQVEIYPGHHAGQSPQQVAEKLKQHGLRCVAYGVVPFKKDPEANRRFFEIGKVLGVKSLSCDPEPDAFDTLDKQVAAYNIAAAIHPHGPGSRWRETKQIYDAVKDHHKLIGLCNDTGHLIRANQDPVEACHVFRDRLYGVHFKDFRKVGDNKWEDTVLGTGELKVDALVKALLELKYQGPLSLEYEGGDPVESAQKSLDRIEAAAKNSGPD